MPGHEGHRPLEPGDGWPGLLSEIRGQRATGFAVDAWERGRLRLGPEDSTDLLEAHRGAMTWCLQVEAKLLRLAEAFDRAGIDYVVLKGPAIAHTLYDDPSLRAFGDVDLLVASRDYDAACDVLASAGHVRQRPEPRPGFEARFGKASVHVHPRDNVEVDLHRALVLGPIGQRLRAESLLANAACFVVGGRSLPQLSDGGQFVSVAMHAALGFRPPRLVPLRDVVAAADRPGIDVEELHAWAGALRLRAVFRFAARAAIADFGLPAPAPLEEMASWPTTKRERRELADYITERRAQGALPTAALRAIPGIRGKGAYVRALVLPDRRFLDYRSAGVRAQRFARMKVPLGWIGARARSGRTRARMS